LIAEAFFVLSAAPFQTEVLFLICLWQTVVPVKMREPGCYQFLFIFFFPFLLYYNLLVLSQSVRHT